ncbi:MAG: dipeptide ABC transporter ATP-binding protein [Rhizobiaceae bacterium]|nr:dipeptide ABC transporter ATP-binding protein [Rhizobiaceae bacterium]
MDCAICSTPNCAGSDSVLSIRDLSLTIGDTTILNHIELDISPGRVMGLVGESGSGKSITALAIMQLLPNASTTSGTIDFDGRNLLQATEKQMCALRGDDIGMVFQEPMTALNPVKTIGEQIAEGIRFHTGASGANARDRTIKILEQVGLPVAKFPLSRYPHELSGGQRQRVVIAIACAMKPKLLIADEPTTALDVTIQAQILDLLRNLVDENKMGLLLISHDLGVIANTADDITIIRTGNIIEAGSTHDILRNQSHPYTSQLIEASTHSPRRNLKPVTAKSSIAAKTSPLLQVNNLICEYPGRRKSLFRKPTAFRAVDDVSFEIFPGQTLALVGESGCGKSTLARTLLRVQEPASGEINFEGNNLLTASRSQIFAARRHMQIVFQDPYGSFNPRHKVARIVSEPMHLAAEKLTRLELVDALEQVGLQSDDLEKYPHEFSGGQRQRLAIARALVTKPRLIIADEPVSALDVSIRAQVLDLLNELREKFGLAYLFITHDLGVVRAFCDDVMVMKEGKIIERGAVSQIFDHPKTAYTRQLLAASPNLQTILKQTKT